MADHEVLPGPNKLVGTLIVRVSDTSCTIRDWAIDGFGQRRRSRPIAPKAPVMRNDALPMAASQITPLIVKPTTTRAIQTESDPEHQGE